MPKYFARQVLSDPNATALDYFDAAVRMAREAGYIQGKRHFFISSEKSDEHDDLIGQLRQKIKLATGG
jgi:hypothetical protein